MNAGPVDVELKLYRPKTDDELYDWVVAVLGVRVPRVAVCDCHVAPFTYLADCYFDRSPLAIALASRGGGKTIISAVLHYMELLHKPGVELASVGAILSQAQKCYRYFKTFARFDRELGLIDAPTMHHTQAASGGRLEVLTGRTAEAVNSPHPHKATLDEIELFKDWRILQEALMMPVSTVDHPSATRLLSTRKYAEGHMQRMIDGADERGFKVYQWCALECGAKCLERDRPSCEPCKAIVKHDANNRPVTWYDVCGERLRKADGYIPTDKLIADFQMLDVEAFLTQIAPCRRPTRGDATFTEFAPELHVVEGLEYDAALEVGTGWDFGLHDPMVCLVIQWSADGDVLVVDEMGSGPLAKRPEEKERLVSDVATELLAKPYGDAIRESRDHWCDPAGRARKTYTRVDSRSAISMLRALGVKARYRTSPNPSRRIAAIKLALRINSATGRPRLFVSSRCPITIAALMFAQWDERKENYRHDDHSHPLDALGYFVDGRFPENRRAAEILARAAERADA